MRSIWRVHKTSGSARRRRKSSRHLRHESNKSDYWKYTSKNKNAICDRAYVAGEAIRYRVANSTIPDGSNVADIAGKLSCSRMISHRSHVLPSQASCDKLRGILGLLHTRKRKWWSWP